MSMARRNLFITIHDAQFIEAAIVDRLQNASSEEATGLRLALELVQEVRRSDPELQVRWCSEALGKAGVDTPDSDVEAIRKVRVQFPEMNLATAVEVVQQARNHP